MARSTYKPPHVSYSIVAKVRALRALGKPQTKPIKVFERGTMIVPEYVGIKFDIHKGNGFVGVEVVEDMLGHKFGEFAFTRRRPNFPNWISKVMKK